MSPFAKVMSKRAIVFPVILVIALVTEFLLLEGTLGVSLPSDRNSAMSTLEVKVKGNGADHFITLNKRFTVPTLLIAFWRQAELFPL